NVPADRWFPKAEDRGHSFPESSESYPLENLRRRRTANFTRLDNFGARLSFGKAERLMFFHDEIPPQRDHHKHAQNASGEGDQKRDRHLQRKTEKDERRHSENDCGGNRLSG